MKAPRSSDKLLPAKIWLVAQLLNAIVWPLVSVELSAFIIPFSFLGGLPAVPVFYFLTWLADHAGSRPVTLLLLALLLPLCTLLAGYITIRLLLGGSVDPELLEYCIPAVAATLVAVLLFSRTILGLKQRKTMTDVHLQ